MQSISNDQPDKGTAPQPLYIITYNRKVSRGYSPTEKVIRFQTEEQYNSWLNRSYATAQDEYIVTVKKRNDVPRKEGREWHQYITIYPNDW
jgi:hypothetical protein